ncbi:MAG: hypothetical protein PUE85_10965 [Firmicutes bacterium]|nr:hypothetical protein [Bacillota bacterium]
MLGIAKKAGLLFCGTDTVCEEIRRHGHSGAYGETEQIGKNKIHKKCGCVVIAGDASANTRKRLTDACKYYNINCFLTGITSDALSDRLGKSGYTVCAAVFERGFTEALIRLLETADK